MARYAQNHIFNLFSESMHFQIPAGANRPDDGLRRLVDLSLPSVLGTTPRRKKVYHVVGSIPDWRVKLEGTSNAR